MNKKNRYNSREKKVLSNNTVIATDKPARAGYAAQHPLPGGWKKFAKIGKTGNK